MTFFFNKDFGDFYKLCLENVIVCMLNLQNSTKPEYKLFRVTIYGFQKTMTFVADGHSQWGLF